MFTVHQFCECLRELLQGRKLTPIADKAGVTQGLLWRLITNQVDSDMGIVKAGKVLESAGYQFDEIVHHLLSLAQTLEKTQRVEIRLPQKEWEHIRSHPDFQHIATTPVRYLPNND